MNNVKATKHLRFVRFFLIFVLTIFSFGAAAERGIAQDTTVYFEAALLIAAVGFVSTVALAKYLAREPVIE